ncbi:MAG: glycoside hydrolase family 3 C-terminal domain-containing protein [Clostridiales bacterium]|nr:glycoside hydrolase family 3 C-terminal domain-containing protein [Roseburia sp.]MDD7636772.1 glycoside hydrolase family 3 C-terminal domain-containing protein [Clostridiales bacterium]MDY4113067.1 glycoside hydrolase family 3 C-terminal domain-containing protein [Roseburia sp.]
MDEKKKEFKARKKAYNKARRKTIRPWKGLTFLSAVVAIIMIPLTVVLSMFDNTVAAFVGGSFWKLENEDVNAQYFTSDFETAEEMTAYGLEVCKQVEAEGAALLLNENHALPLDAGAKVSCFSGSSVNLVYGGTGSGNIDASKADTLKSALESTGMEVNGTLWDFYNSEEAAQYARFDGDFTSSAKVVEVPWDVYPQEVIDSVAGYGDAAIVTFSRVGGEGADLEFADTNYLALNDDEKAMMEHLAAMKADGTIGKIIVLINTANPLQVDFLKDNVYDVDACLWIGDVGITGINAVAEILAGTVNPSGSLVDTYCYDNYSSPAMANFVPTTYEGYEEGIIPDNAKSYMIYQEGIYVGYKYYETRYEDYVMGTGNAGSYAYGDEVAFPFGFGLSYTDFAYSDMAVNYNASTDQFEVKVTVTNTGDTYSGKETVQVYSQSPYTAYDIANGVEKASVALCGFAKTGILAPGASETVTVYVDKRDLASFDAYGAGTYILDDGDYYLTVATDAHNAVNNTLAAKGYTVESTEGRMDADGDAALAYKWTQESFDATTYATSANGTEITAQLSESDINLYSGNDGQGVTYLTRNDWTGTFPTQITQLALTEQMIGDLQDIQYDPADYEAVMMPTLGADNGMKLVDMVGKEYDDPAWDALLDQLTFDEMVSMIGDSFHWTMPMKSVEAPGTREENGPQGLTASLLGSDATQLEATAFTSEDVMAATFNVDLMTEVGRVIGNNCLHAEIACLYGPGNNIHRTPYGGRNFEYYSEDGFLSGKISQYEVAAIQAKGVDVVMKHFALNDCEQDRIGLGVWLGEQAAREVYLKAFQAPFEYGDANGVMMAYTRWGTQWSGGNKNLVTGIMRGEWGSNGKSITDNVLTTYVNGVDGILAGTSYFDAMMPYVTQLLPKYEDDAVIVTAMREACHHNLYALVNSCGINGLGNNTTIKVIKPTVITICMILACGFTFLFFLSVVMWIIKKRKFNKSEICVSFKEYKAAYKAEKNA